MRLLNQITDDEALLIAKILMPQAFMGKPKGWKLERLNLSDGHSYTGIHIANNLSNYFLIIDFDNDEFSVICQHHPEMAVVSIETTWKVFQLLEKLNITTKWMKDELDLDFYNGI